MESKFFTVGNKKVYFLCGEIHYFRVPKGLWFDRLLKVKRAGLNCVPSYIAWNWHEPIENLVLFGDEIPDSPYESRAFSRDLEGYIMLAKELGLYFIARPGPYICSEWDSGGHPNWLYTKNVVLRSLDENYIRYVEKWYSTVLPIIARYTVSKGGPIALLQIENEYFWGDAPYHLKLYEIARRHVVDIPIVTNENYSLADEDPIINTIDDYPLPWDIASFDDKIKRYLGTQRSKPKMFMELEGGWFTVFGGPLPTSRGSFPPEWTEMLMKTAFGLGINGISIYMFHGGTNPGYYTGKYITTTYDYEAAIREWGELSPRYYTIKRFAYFVKTFHDFVISTRPSEGLVKVLGDGVDMFIRIDNSNRVVVVLRNIDEWPKFVKLAYNEKVYPYFNPITVPSRSTKLIFLSYSIDNTPFKIVYTSLEPLILVRHNSDVVLIFYGDVYEVGEIAVESGDIVEVELSMGISVEKISDKTIVASCTISDDDKILVLRAGFNKLYIVVISRSRAERTWYVDDFDYPLVLISNLYFIGKTLRTDSSMKLELDVDDRSCGSITLISFKPIDSIKIDGREVVLEKVAEPIYRFYYGVCHIDDAKIEVRLSNTWKTYEDPLALGIVEVESGKPLEFLGGLLNGYSVYTIEFNMDIDTLNNLKNKTMFISSLNDYATAILNGYPLTSNYHSIEVDVSQTLREGVNKLIIIVESTGHTNDGLVYIPNGIVEGIYLGKVGEVVLARWRYIELRPIQGREFSLAMYLRYPRDIEEKLKDVKAIESAPTVQILSSPGLYIKEISVDKMLGRYILDLGKIRTNYYTPILVFVNKKFIGFYIGPTDITDHLNDGLNEIAIATTRGPLYPRLKIYQRLINGIWRVKIGTEGLSRKLYDKNYDDSYWKEVSIPLQLKNMMGKVIWVRGSVYIRLSKNMVTPLKLVFRGSGIRALIYFNGQFIGRYTDEGPQTEFYIYEPIVEDGENKIAIMLHITNNNASVNYINIKPYYVHLKSAIEIKYQS